MEYKEHKTKDIINTIEHTLTYLKMEHRTAQNGVWVWKQTVKDTGTGKESLNEYNNRLYTAIHCIEKLENLKNRALTSEIVFIDSEARTILGI